MGRKYGLGKYGAGTYDLEPATGIVYFAGALGFAINLQGDVSVRSPISLGGHLSIEVSLSGSVRRLHYSYFGGALGFVVGFNSLGEYIGPAWEEFNNEDDQWIPIPGSSDLWAPVSAAPDIWVPITEPGIPPRV